MVVRAPRTTKLNIGQPKTWSAVARGTTIKMCTTVLLLNEAIEYVTKIIRIQNLLFYPISAQAAYMLRFTYHEWCYRALGTSYKYFGGVGLGNILHSLLSYFHI